MKGTPEMSVIRMSIPITSKYERDRGKIEYTLQFSDDVHIPGTPHPMFSELKELGAGNVHFDVGDHSFRFVLEKGVAPRQAFQIVAEYLRWLHDFGGGVEFKHACPHCGHEENFVL